MTNYHFTLLFIFLSTLSLRRATRPRRLKSRRCVFLSTLSLRRATVTVLGIQHKVGISIHALLAESDVGREPTAGRNDKFLSTLSLRRATFKPPIKTHRQKHFYPRSPCGERPLKSCKGISYFIFLSTLSLRRATGLGVGLYLVTEISIHALLAESDYQGQAGSAGCLHFYPRSPCGERRRRAANCYLDKLISIHALLAESDYRISARYTNKVISIHALLAESDVLAWCSFGGACDFYPRSPCGERPVGL